MPALPSAPSSAPSFLASPAVGLAFFVLVFAVVTALYAAHGCVSRKLAARRTRCEDVENYGTKSVVFVNVKGKARPHPKETLTAARQQLEALKTNIGNVSLHKQLMAHHISVPIAVAVPPAVYLAKREVLKPSAGLFIQVQERITLGPSPLRAVHTLPPLIVEESAGVRAPEAPILSARARLLQNIALDYDTESDSDYSGEGESFNLDDFPLPPTTIPTVAAPRAPALTDSRLKNAWRAAHHQPPPIPTKRRLPKKTSGSQNKENTIA